MARLYHAFADYRKKLDVLRLECINCERKNVRFGVGEARENAVGEDLAQAQVQGATRGWVEESSLNSVRHQSVSPRKGWGRATREKDP
jgi:hypothetical protein